MVREALAWWAKDNKLLERLDECEKKMKEAENKTKKDDKTVKPDRVLSECLKQLEPERLKLQELRVLSCLAGLVLHLDAFGLKKDVFIRSYSKALTEIELKKSYKRAENTGAVLNITEEQAALFPPGTFHISFNFQLRKPYISKDDTEFYVIDNPVKKDWVFKVPYIAPGQWKGCLHAAMVHQLADWWAGILKNALVRDDEKSEFIMRRLQLVRLFGNEQGVEVDTKDSEAYLDRVGGSDLSKRYRKSLKKIAPEGHRRGRLMFYPTFFDRLGLEVINPHDRKTGAGKLPIYFETVPEKTCGRFALLYVPFDRVGKDAGETIREAAEDLCRVAEGIAFLCTEFGFGAKTSNGFGLAAPELLSEGEIALRLAVDTGKTKNFKTLDSKDKTGLTGKAKELIAGLPNQGGGGSDSR